MLYVMPGLSGVTRIIYKTAAMCYIGRQRRTEEYPVCLVGEMEGDRERRVIPECSPIVIKLESVPAEADMEV